MRSSTSTALTSVATADEVSSVERLVVETEAASYPVCHGPFFFRWGEGACLPPVTVDLFRLCDSNDA